MIFVRRVGTRSQRLQRVVWRLVTIGDNINIDASWGLVLTHQGMMRWFVLNDGQWS